jgi:hypothetical protein
MVLNDAKSCNDKKDLLLKVTYIACNLIKLCNILITILEYNEHVIQMENITEILCRC